MAKAAKKDPKYTIRCAYCAQDDFKLYDVDMEAEVRQYTDTPAKIQLARVEVAKKSIATPCPFDQQSIQETPLKT